MRQPEGLTAVWDGETLNVSWNVKLRQRAPRLLMAAHEPSENETPAKALSIFFATVDGQFFIRTRGKGALSN